MAHKISLDKSKCISCGACSATCPKAFGFKDGRVFVKTPSVDKITCEESARDGCPVSAISIS
jgi:ferredoxin